MKKICLLIGLFGSLSVIADVSTVNNKIAGGRGFNFEGIARVNSERLGNTLSWLQTPSESEGQALRELATEKLDKLSDRFDSLKESLVKKLSPEQMKELQALKDKINKHVETIKNMTPVEKKAWREKLKFKFDQLPQEIMLFSKKIEATIPEESAEEFKDLQEKSAKFVDWLKNMPATDKEALQKTLTEKVEKLKERAGVLKQLGVKANMKKSRARLMIL